LESVWNLLQNPFDITRLTLGMLLHYLGKLKIQIFCRYSAHMEENANNFFETQCSMPPCMGWVHSTIMSVKYPATGNTIRHLPFGNHCPTTVPENPSVRAFNSRLRNSSVSPAHSNSNNSSDMF